MLNRVSLLICSFVVSACISTPGLNEPVVTEYTLDFPTSWDGTQEVPTESLLGCSVVCPTDRAKISNHHDALHTRLNECLRSEK